MKWIYLICAGVFEVGWAVAMNYSDGFSKVIPSIITAIGYLLSALFLSFALKELPLSTTYAMWTGFGIVGTTILGVILFNEKLTLPQCICLIMIVVGVVGLKLLGTEK